MNKKPKGPIGRPRQPLEAATAAKRKERQRERDATMIWERPISELPDRCLLQILASGRFQGLQEQAWRELGRRRQFTYA